MILYGTRIDSDFIPSPKLPEEGEYLRTLRLRQLRGGEGDEEFGERTPLYRAHGRAVFLRSSHSFHDNLPDQRWSYEVEGVVSFRWRTGSGEIHYRLQEAGTVALLTFWLTHLFLPLYLTLEREVEFFHAGAVESAGMALLFLAPSTGGKSTLTDYFLLRGHPLLTDDKAATFFRDGAAFVAGAHPYHRPFRAFETLGHEAARFSDRFLPLGALYLLEPSPPEAEVSIGPIHGFARFDALKPHFLFQFSFLRAEQFRYLGALLGETPVYRIAVPRDLERLEEVRQAILAQEERRMR
jgi:hypothetical protein